MPNRDEVKRWVETIRSRYISYLTTSFHFRDPALRRSFREALRGQELLKGPIPEHGRRFPRGVTARQLAEEAFPEAADQLLPALLDGNLHAHQERAIRAAHFESENVVAASGTASGKTECFLYPILFSLFREHLAGSLDRPGVRALVLYPMNALVNDQRQRLGELCRALEERGSDFRPRFGQYIGQTPENPRDRFRNGPERGESRLPGERVFREEIRETPPHILFTNFSMLEYLLIRPQDTPLFDGGRAANWRFLVFDEAHSYRGAKGIEMAMLIRRLKQRLREGGRRDPFRCLATSATIASGQTAEDARKVADFAAALFGEPFDRRGVVFGHPERVRPDKGKQADIRRHHVFVRALEGAFLIHDRGEARVALNRASPESDGGAESAPLEIALCRECGQHYFVGRRDGGRLIEAVRDPSHPAFGVEYYLPEAEGADTALCRRCAAMDGGAPGCDCDAAAAVMVRKCENHPRHRDRLAECDLCGYTRGGVGDPVQEIVHGADGPNAVLATAVHGLLPPDAQKILAFADSRQDAAFFAWYAEDSYTTVRDRNLLLKAIRPRIGAASEPPGTEALSIRDSAHRLARVRGECGLASASETWEEQIRNAHTTVLSEVFAEDARLSLAGVGLAQWFVALPETLPPPREMLSAPWNLSRAEARTLLPHLLDLFRSNRAMDVPEAPEFPMWKAVSGRPQQAFTRGAPASRRNLREWGGLQSAVVRFFLPRLLGAPVTAADESRNSAARDLMKAIWQALREHDERVPERDRLLSRADRSGGFRLKTDWLRLRAVEPGDLWECRVCARIAASNIRGACLRYRCPGTLVPASGSRLAENHYRALYETRDLPARMTAAEHTAQLTDEVARQRQTQFKNGGIHLLSSSTTFEVGVDLGDLEVTFLRNVPPEPFNYAQRVGRAGRRERSGLALTYCRRSPHDLHYFANPAPLVLGTVVPPRLRISNERIVIRHMTAMALSGFFRAPGNRDRFSSVAGLVGKDWKSPSTAEALSSHCRDDPGLLTALRDTVPPDLHDAVGLGDGRWIENIAGGGSSIVRAMTEVCDEYRALDRAKDDCLRVDEYWKAARVRDRMKTIASEGAVNFLARRAVIPKYGFPVDVVELHTGVAKEAKSVELSRDLSLALSEYAPGSRVVANKLEWESCGVRVVAGKQPPVRQYSYDEARNFASGPDFDEGSEDAGRGARYLVPEFGFVAPMWLKPKAPERRSERLFSTRPFFRGFVEPESAADERILWGVGVTEAVPGALVVLCEGRNRTGFLLCRSCGMCPKQPGRGHKTREGAACEGEFERLSLGHELVTDVVKVRFPERMSEPDAFSVAYALVLGAADAVAVPQRDLNVTLSGESIVLYDDVPGGAGLVAQLADPAAFRLVLERARERVSGGCGCDRSCYGCLRSYRNQFLHTELDRRTALAVLDAALMGALAK